MREHRKLTDKQIQWAYDKWCLGYTQFQIAEALDCSEKTVAREFKEHNYSGNRIRPILKYEEQSRTTPSE